MRRIKTLIHVHTDYSFDSDLSVEALARFLDVHDFGCVAVTDHDSIEGGRRLRGRTRAKVIVGSEISTRGGHLIGLFLKEHIPAGMSVEDTIAAIRMQSGVVLLPHPFAPACFGGLGDAAWRIAHLVDAVEVNNAQSFWKPWDRRAAAFAERCRLTSFVGSDSHMGLSIAPCYQYLPDFDGPSDFVRALHAAELIPGYHPAAYFAAMAYRDFRYHLGLGLPRSVGGHAAATAPARVPVPCPVSR